MIDAGIGLVQFVLEIFKYHTANKLFFSKKLEKLWIAIPIGMGLSFYLLINQDMKSSGKQIIVYFLALMISFFLMREKWNHRLRNFIILFFVLNVMDSIADTLILAILLLITKDNYPLSNRMWLINIVTFIFLETLVWLKKRSSGRIKKMWNAINKNVHYLVIIMAITMLATISGLMFAEKYVSSPQFSMMVYLLSGLSYLSIGILGIFIFYIKKTNAKLEEVLQNEKMLKDMQKHYYEVLLEKEEDTRRYRHDMVNHLLCLNSLAQQEKIEDLKAYLDKMQEQTKIIQKKGFLTGNQILDIISNFYLDSLEDVNIKISGHVTSSLSIDNVSLCIIYANLLKNAVEEVERSKKEDRFININLIQGTEYLQILIQNSLSEQSKRKENILITGKADKKNHGIGLRNVNKVTEEYGGKIEIQYNDKSFEVKVILRLSDHSRS